MVFSDSWGSRDLSLHWHYWAWHLPGRCSRRVSSCTAECHLREPRRRPAAHVLVMDGRTSLANPCGAAQPALVCLRSLREGRMKRACILLLASCALARSYSAHADALLWNNGPLVNAPFAGSGGAHDSRVQTELGLSTVAFAGRLSTPSSSSATPSHSLRPISRRLVSASMMWSR